MFSRGRREKKRGVERLDYKVAIPMMSARRQVKKGDSMGY
jgi:hypothetical protein